MSARNKPAAGANRRRYRNDCLFLAALVTTVAVAGLCFYRLRAAGDTVEVLVDGEPYATYRLDENRVVELYTGAERHQHNRLVIQDGAAFITAATCPDGICADHRPIAREGESIVCLPHRVVITVRRTHTGEQPDIVI